jgi:hypothetical protein
MSDLIARMFAEHYGEDAADFYRAQLQQAAAHLAPVPTLPLIHTEHVRPPIPVREYDWSAVFEDYEPGQLMGWGATRAAAIADLLSQVESS